MIPKVLLRFEVLLVIGAIITVWSSLNVFGITNTDSDVFWALFGAGAVIEGLIELVYGDRDEQ